MTYVAILNPGETLTAVMSGAANSVNPHYAAEWHQDSESSGENQPVGALNGATAVTMVAAPTTGQRFVDSVRIFNADGSEVTVTLAKATSIGTFTLAKVTLQVGDLLVFDERRIGVLDPDGQGKSITATA